MSDQDWRPAAERPALSVAAVQSALREGSAGRLLLQGNAEQWLPWLGAGTVQLGYLDPPFGTGKDRVGERGAYEDWQGDPTALASHLSDAVETLWQALDERGNLIVHLDWHLSHYVKVELDRRLGRENFRNEIVWCYSGGGVAAYDYARKHDVLLRYARSTKPRFHVERKPFKENTQQVGRHSTYARDVRIDLERGTPLTDWWTDIPTVTGWSQERCGYPTQKPIMLLRRLISTLTDPDGLVVDPFGGSGTTAVAAAGLGRRFAVGDRLQAATEICLRRLSSEGCAADWCDITEEGAAGEV